MYSHFLWHAGRKGKGRWCTNTVLADGSLERRYFYPSSLRALGNSRIEMANPLEVWSLAVFLWCPLCLHRAFAEQVSTHPWWGGGECLPLVRSIFTFGVHMEQAPSLCSRMVIRMIVKTTGFISITYINTFYVTSLHSINPFNLPNDLIGWILIFLFTYDEAQQFKRTWSEAPNWCVNKSRLVLG